ncbi:MAG TPA: hypothetical protein VE173_15080, partial [Longimicrobiales bacterium]|nr:hypothetical protein [Longimicrobiales bacterium]
MELRTRFGKLVGILAAMALVAACAPPTATETTIITTAPGSTSPVTTSGGTATSVGGTATTEAAGGGTIVVGRTGDIDNLDPHLATAFQTIDALELVYDTLFELDSDLNVKPGLATDWEYSDDGTQLT